MNFKERYQYNPKTDLLGKGGFARVYKAVDTVLDREVALKIFSTDTSQKYDLVSEIKKVIKLEHPNLCRYYDVAFIESLSTFGEEEKHQIGVLEYLDGGDLKSYCIAHPQEQVKLLTDVLKGLAYLHANGIIHRDLKPANILIKKTAQGPVAKITDFGISKDVGGSHTSSSLLMGTIEYMAPEQFSPLKYGIDGRIGTNLDLWSFGLMAFEIVTRESLFGSRGGNSSAEQVMGNILNDDLIEDKIAHLPDPYLSVVKRCLIKDAKQRVQSAEELVALINNKSNPISTDQVQETQVIPKAVTINNADETRLLVKEKATEVVSPQLSPTKKKSNAKRNVFAILIGLTAITCLSFWYLKRQKTLMKIKFYPAYDIKSHKYGLADSEGHLISEFKYDFIDSVKNGVAVMVKDGKWGYMDSAGKEIFTGLKFAYRFNDELGVGINPPVGDEVGGYLVIDKRGKVIFSSKNRIYSYSDDLACIEMPFYINLKNGNELLDNSRLKKSTVWGQYTGGDGEYKAKSKYGYINKAGQLIIQPKYDQALDFSDGLAAVGVKMKWGFIDKTGKEVIPLKYTWAMSFFNNRALIEQEPGRVYFIKPNGQSIGDPYEMALPFSEGLAWVKLDSSYQIPPYFIDTAATDLPLNHEGNKNVVGSFHNGLALYKSGNKFGYIDKHGKITIPAQYTDATDFSDSLAVVSISNPNKKEAEALFGAINTSGKIVLPYKYVYISAFIGGFSKAFKENSTQTFLIDKLGKEIVGLPLLDWSLPEGYVEKKWGKFGPNGRILDENFIDIFGNLRDGLLFTGDGYMDRYGNVIAKSKQRL